jgi:hypothetical protein
MKPVDQTVSGNGNGDCMRAVLASLFEQKFEDTVDVYGYPEGEWVIPFMDWIESIGYEYEGVVHMFVDPVNGVNKKRALRDLSKFESVGGYFYGAVNSRSFKDVTHAVIIDALGIVVHDPSPSKTWLGENLIATKELLYVHTFSRK